MTFLKENFKKLNIDINEEQLVKFQKYLEFLIEYNKKVNLTAIIDPKEIIVKHFIDSVMINKKIKIPKASSVIDIGTGAGFPGVPIKIINPEINITLLDSLKKRLFFLEQLINLVDIEADLIHARAEQLSREKKYREVFDIAVSRAVASLSVLSEYCLPFVKVGGFFISMKGEYPENEIEASKNAINKLGGIVDNIEKFKLPDNSGRSLVIIKKISATKSIYPRTSVKISKKPL